MTCLHLLTPLSSNDPAGLLAEGIAHAGDTIADARLFPPRVFAVGEKRELADVTGRVLPDPDYWADARAWLADFTRKTGLQERLAIDGVGFWWARHCLKFTPALSEYGNLFAWVDMLRGVRASFRPGAITLYGHHDPLIHLTEQIFPNLTVDVTPAAKSYSATAKQPPRQFGLLLARLLMGIVGLLILLFRRPRIGFFANTNLLRRERVGERLEMRDPYLGEVAAAARARGLSTIFVEKYGWNASWAGFLARGLFFPNDWLFLLTQPIAFRLGLFRRTMSRWRVMWKEARPVVAQHARYRDVDLAPLLLPLIRKEFLRYAPGFEVMAHAWKRILRRWRPALLYVNCSYGPSAMTAIIAARQLGITTIEQQHGAVSKNNMAYLIPPDLGRVENHLCDLMTVWGERMTRLLAGAGVYRPEQVVVCGSPRVDRLLENLPPRALTLSQLGISPEAPVALYTSNMLAEGFMGAILDSVRAAPPAGDLHWIIKLHPREKTRPAWDAAIAERGLENVTMVEGEADFYALLAACDIHISLASTTLLEAAILGKVNLGLDAAHMPDPAGYAEANAFLPVPPAELGATVTALLKDPGRVAHLRAEQKAFAGDWCVHDGKAVARIVTLLEQVCSGDVTRPVAPRIEETT